MIFELTIIGTSSATPTKLRQPSAQILNINEQLYLIDCGEGTQIQLKRLKIRFNRINHIFISHLHGDHYLGLLGLISTMHLEGRTQEIHLYGHPGLEEIITLQLKYAETRLNFQIHYHHLISSSSELIFENSIQTVHTIPLNHRVPCYGFLFKEKKRKKKILAEKIDYYNIPKEKLQSLKNGEDYQNNNIIVPNNELTLEPPDPRSYAYCSDTIYDEKIIPLIKRVDLLYHESTFMQDMLERAQETYHTTTIQAATIAKKANVKKLLLGHFSARYTDLQPMLDEAKSIFPETMLAIEGNKYLITEFADNKIKNS